MAKIAVLGAGTWGTALARTFTLGGNKVTLWSALEREIDYIREHRRHHILKEMVIPKEMKLTCDIGEAITGKDIIVFAVPSLYVRSTAKSAAPFITDNQIIVDVAKGLEAGSYKTLTEVIADEINNPKIPMIALSGPTHAEELALDMPTAIVAACPDEIAAAYVQKVFSNHILRVYTNKDIRGIEICGALKNIIALAAGMSDGLGFGDNAKAAIVTRGMAEIKRLGLKMGCSADTFSSLAGIGDLIVTCTSRHSRNNRTGFMIAQGVKPEDAIKEVGMVVEGINALPAAMELSTHYDVELPICSMVNHIINGTISVSSALRLLMSRELKTEAE